MHHAKPVKAWPAERVDEIEVFSLSPYRAGRNSDAMLSAALKATVTKQAPARTKGCLKKRLSVICVAFRHRHSGACAISGISQFSMSLN